MHHHHRRRKKRPNYGTRTVEVSRGFNGFGFTISGQAPCILSCIVANSPADQAGLRAGDFLISVNGMNVSKLPHEAVVQLIGNSLGTIRMQIAEHYFSDSSDEENVVNQINRVRPRYLHHKHKMNRLRNSPQKSRNSPINSMADQQSPLHPVIEDAPPSVAHNIIRTPNASTSKDISNVSAMVRKTSDSSQPEMIMNENVSLEYRAIVGYLGTIEMPKQIATSSKLQTVRSCIRKMRQEKRNPTTVLMTILPNCLTLKNANSSVLATYPSTRLNYVSSSSESENRFFGLVTSAIYASIDDDPIPLDGLAAIPHHTRDVIISNSCHVFVVDTKICDHAAHEGRAAEFKITCTKDPISNLCLEFPNNSEYVVNLIRSMYTMKVLPPSVRHAGSSRQHEANAARNAPEGFMQANSPQPSNHSEITTTSSNSDSGIGFHNDCTNISDRILVVDFPGLVMNRINNVTNNRPHAICNSIDPDLSPKQPVQPFHVKSKSADFNTRLTVRAMPDPKVVIPPSKKAEIPDLLASFNSKNPSTLTATRSCDDVITSVERSCDFVQHKDKRQLQMSIDDITMLAGSANGKLTESEYEFLQPEMPLKKTKKPTNAIIDDSNLLSYKLSPKVFGVNRPNSMSFENLPRDVNREDHGAETLEAFEVWGSLQELRNTERLDEPNFLEGTYSEPELLSRAFPTTGSSPFRRWGQSSFRSARIPETRTSLARRPSSLAASDNDVYTKSIDDYNNHDLDSHRSQSEELTQSSSEKNAQERSSVVAWGQSFEKLLEDPAGLHTFAEFLKKEFSAENIYFWTACERYKQIVSDEDRAVLAMNIFTKHLANGAPEPVNVDSQARNIAEENLRAADRNLFVPAQKQIFNLMKFDSYQRFIRSDLYKKCIEAESKNQPLPYPADQLDEVLITNLSHFAGHSKLKKSASNAEDRRRKSILPWHRKARCKSRDRADSDCQNNTKTPNSKSSSSGNALKPYSTNSTSDIHSSRSSLSSFDAATAFANGSDDLRTSLCRVILCNGATTIVQTRPNETIRQLVERLLEKRGIQYKFFDVLISGKAGKPLELDQPSTELAGKEVEIEQRVAFKLDLPDPKVISVKSKPKKALGDVLKPILQKYNYRIEEVQVLIRETHEPLTMDLPVTVADGLRLQVVLLNLDGWQQNHVQQQQQLQQQQQTRPSQAPTYQNSQHLQLPRVLPHPIKIDRPGNQQVTLDEITNRVFNELLQGKANAHANAQQQSTKTFDQNSVKSDDCASETSSIFERLRRRESSSAGIKVARPRKIMFPKPSTAVSEDGLSTNTQATTGSDLSGAGIKKPLIAKWKTGVKLQVTGHRAEKHEEFLEGLKRAQRARLEDQRGTEINSELPDFLKNKENLNAISKLRKTNQLSNDSSSTSKQNEPVPSARSSLDSAPGPLTLSDRPQPAPRFSITKSNTCASIFPTKSSQYNGNYRPDPMNTSTSSSNSNNISPTRSTASNDSNDFESNELKAPPPPLPPKPKILPMKPSNWGQSPQSANSSPTKAPDSSVSAVTRRHLNLNTDHQHQNSRNVYLDQPTSSFV